MQLEANEIHVWSADLTMATLQNENALSLLSDDERERAFRFRFQKHQRRYIAARSALRQILSTYLKIAPQEIVFGYAEHQKPFLQFPRQTPIQFNLAHSHELAVYAITMHHPVGIDVEKIKTTEYKELSKRFFSKKENDYLQKLSGEEQALTFFRIWSRKEAVIKAIGKGLSIPLSSFTVAGNDVSETLLLEDSQWSLVPIALNSDYACALASNQEIKKITLQTFM